jgi:hypothetical protein
MCSSTKDKTRILTVGDGDLSLSLALARAYGNCVSLTASVLDSEEDLLKAYPDAPIKELKSLNVEVLYGLDATHIHEKFPTKSWDLTCFHHPHLGLASLDKNEAEHANRHFMLLCHYLYSAGKVSEFVHICLCGTQPDTWRLFQAAEFCQMKLSKRVSTSGPFCKLWTEDELEPAEAKPNFAAPRRYRNGKLGSRHMLGKYGYRHRRTEGERYKGRASDTNVAGSMHYVFQSRADTTVTEEAPKSALYTCNICQATYSSHDELSIHLSTPAMPDIKPTTVSDAKSRLQTLTKSNENKLKDSKSISCIDYYSDRKKKQLKVTKEYEGKRLRWFIQHGIQGLSKKKAEVSIQGGLVIINDSVVLESSRILACGDTVLVSSVDGTNSSSGPKLEILHRKAPLLVVFKPAGMRTKGQFPNTLESTISEQEGSVYYSLSPLDTSCAGICALIQTGHEKDPPSILHSMTALIYGTVPDGWRPCREVTINVEPKWKKRKHNKDISMHQESLKLFPVDTTKTHQDSVPLTSLRIETSYPCASSLCRFLRLEGYGVVGDNYCRQEYLKMKRSIRNRIKDKLCMGCYQIQVDGVEISQDVPEKLLASFWDAHYDDDK